MPNWMARTVGAVSSCCLYLYHEETAVILVCGDILGRASGADLGVAAGKVHRSKDTSQIFSEKFPETSTVSQQALDADAVRRLFFAASLVNCPAAGVTKFAQFLNP